MIFIQGRDFKAQKWAEHLKSDVSYFSSVTDMWGVVRRIRIGDGVVFRYQNNPKSLFVSLVVTFLVVLILFAVKLRRAKVFWVCHNVDQDTSLHHKRVERFRRFVIQLSSEKIFVLHREFLKHVSGQNIYPISFGRKDGGETSKKTIGLIAEHSRKFDRLVLIAGQDGGKYRHFDRLALLTECFSRCGLNVGFILAGVSESRRFSGELSPKILKIYEKNIDEKAISEYVDFVYRENEDISMPYTVYASCSAKIPVITSSGSVLSEILTKEEIGFPLGVEALAAALAQEKWGFEQFLARNTWASLSRYLN